MDHYDKVKTKYNDFLKLVNQLLYNIVFFLVLNWMVLHILDQSNHQQNFQLYWRCDQVVL